MSLQTRLSDFITAVGTDYKQLRTWITGSNTNTLSGLTTTVKTDLVSAINEVKAGNSGAPPAASETVSGIAELATQIETNTGTDDLRIVTPLKFQTRLAAFAQPLDSDLTAIAALTTTAFGRALLTQADQAAYTAANSLGTELLPGILELATQAETNTGTDDVRAVTPLKFQTRLAAFAQPLDSDLTSIAALATTAYGRAFLALADQTAFMALISAASDTVQGKVELATDAETTTGTDTARAITPANAAALFTNRIATSTSLGTSNTLVPSQNAVKTYVDGNLDVANALQYKGVIDASTNPNYPAASAGWLYKISVAGKIGGASGPNVEVGDTLIANVDGSAAGTEVAVGANWTILQSNIDGAVTGPASAVAADFATFSGTSGKVIQDSGLSFDADGTMAANSAVKIPAQSAVRTYVGATNYTKTELGNPETDLVALYTTAKA